MTAISNLTTSDNASLSTSAPVTDLPGFIAVTDARGRLIKARMLKAFDRMRLFKTIGGELAGNGPYFGYAVIAASVTEIAGDHVGFPTTQLQLEALVQRLDDDGLQAVSKGLATLMSSDEGEAAVEETAKN